MNWWTVLGTLLVLYATFYILIVLLSHKPRPSKPSEHCYITNSTTIDNNKNVETTDLIKFDTNNEKIEFSLVVPCYNETKRLGIMLDEAVNILISEFTKDQFEIILVDDGSKDGTSEYAIEWAHNHSLKSGIMKVCQLEHNRGKGGAVTHGMRFTTGKLALFADADGASSFKDMLKLKSSIKENNADVAIGSRAHMVNSDVVVQRSFIRNFLMYGLHSLVYVFGIRTIGDTQCGFKMFTHKATRMIFPYMHTEGWIFDVEVLMIALKKSLKVDEVAISWHEVEGSKIDLARDSINMAIDLVVTRMAYIIGIYNETQLTHSN